MILSYLKRISLFDSTRMMSMADLVAISVETLRIDSECHPKKEFTKLISINPFMILYQIFNQFDSCHSCVHGPFT